MKKMETFSTLLAICAVNSMVTGEFPSQRPVTWSFDVFFDLRLNKRLSKQSRRWFQMPSHSLWCHCNETYWYSICYGKPNHKGTNFINFWWTICSWWYLIPGHDIAVNICTTHKITAHLSWHGQNILQLLSSKYIKMCDSHGKARERWSQGISESFVIPHSSVLIIPRRPTHWRQGQEVILITG